MYTRDNKRKNILTCTRNIFTCTYKCGHMYNTHKFMYKIYNINTHTHTHIILIHTDRMSRSPAFSKTEASARTSTTGNSHLPVSQTGSSFSNGRNRSTGTPVSDSRGDFQDDNIACVRYLHDHLRAVWYVHVHVFVGYINVYIYIYILHIYIYIYIHDSVVIYTNVAYVPRRYLRATLR
jgi:hypothetical protein